MLRLFGNILLLAASCGVLCAQTPPGDSPSNNVIRIWLSDKEVKSVQGEFSSTDLLKELNAKCINVVLTDRSDAADYRLEAGRAWCCTPNGQSRGYNFTLFDKDGDAVASTKTHTLANAVKDICNAIGRGKIK